MTTKQTLLQTLQADRQTVHELRNADGGSLLIMQHGGRILGLYTRDDAENLLWVNPRLYQPEGQPESAHAALNDAWWPNTGGNRIWISPEVDVNIGADGQYGVPRALDPGQYALSVVDQTARLDLSAKVALHRSGAACEVQIERHIAFVPNPLRHERDLADVLGRVRYVGYQQATTLTLAQSTDDAAQVGMWDIVQLPTPGHMLVPTFGPTGDAETAPWQALIGDPAAKVAAHAHGVKVHMGPTTSFKLGVRAVHTVGRAGYIRPLSHGEHMLVVRNFDVNLSGDYIDVPPNDAEDFGYAFQCYNDDGKLGQFGELEYHAPAVSLRYPQHTDTAQLWAFEGNAADIQAIASILLGPIAHDAV